MTTITLRSVKGAGLTNAEIDANFSNLNNDKAELVSPSFTTPTLGVASATTINKVTITTPATGSSLTIADGKTLTALKTFSFTAADDTGVYTLPTGTKTLVATDVATLSSLVSVGAITTGTWNATAVGVQYGGTGRATGATAYGLIAAGTTATGAQQTLAAGATTEILVGGGTSALPVWTTATGSGAPVRATSPTLVTPILGVATATSLQSIVGNVTPAAGTFTALTSTTSTTLASESVALAANNLPVVRPTLLLDFANSKIVDPRITFTRASTATRTNEKGLLETVASGAPRIDYDPVTLACKGLLVEESRTNLLTYSEQFDNAAWTKSRTTISANAATAPDGAVTADTIIEDTTASNTHQCHLTTSSLTSGTAYTVSLFVKAASGTRYIALTLGGTAYASAVYAVFTLNESVAPSVTGSGTGAIQNVGNGWFRISLTATAQASGTALLIYYLSNAATTGGLTYTGDGTSGIYIWGAQLEAGSFATSYIPTTSAQVTRAADIATMTGSNFSSWYRQDEGTFVVGFDLCGIATADSQTVFSANDTTGSNRITFRSSGPSANNATVVFVSGANQAALTSTIPTANAASKTATAYKINDFSYSDSNGAVVTDTSGTIPVVTQLSIGNTVGGSYLNGHISKISYYPTRLANATLVALSTP